MYSLVVMKFFQDCSRKAPGISCGYFTESGQERKSDTEVTALNKPAVCFRFEAVR